jgi:hypothetical protein
MNERVLLESAMNERVLLESAKPFIFAWALNATECRKTIFDKKKCVEVADIGTIYGFIKAEMGISYQGHHRYDFISVVYPNELEQMKKYKALFNKTTKKFQVSFHMTKHKWGRIIPANNLSMSIFHRPTRHCLCEPFYIDVDMKTAQPSMVSEICKHHGISCIFLDKYVKNPKKYLQFIMNHHNCVKDVAKNLIISILFGGKYESWMKENDIKLNENKLIHDVCEIEKEINLVIEIVYNANPHIKRDVLKQDPTKWKTESECKRGVMALWGQSVEKLIQETAILFLVEKKNFVLEDIVPSQDGFMILKENWYDDLLIDIGMIVKTKFNMKIDFINKPFDQAIEIPYHQDIKTFNEWDDLLSAKCLADRFIEEFGKYFVLNNGHLYVFWGDKINGDIVNGRWFDETNKAVQFKTTLYIAEDLYSLIQEQLTGAVELNDTERHELLKTLRTQTSKGSCMVDIIKHIKTKVRKTTKDFDSDPYLLGFNNGVYDLSNDEFRDYTFTDYITMTTKYDYEIPDYSIPETQSLKEELSTLLETIHPDPDTRLLYLQVLASGLDGRAYQKLFLFNGQGGNGKGLTGALMDKVLGEYYHQPSNGILKDVEKANSPSPDMINLKGKRYINFKEVAGSIRVAVVRNLTGGGKFNGRFLMQNPEQFFMSATFVMEFNIPPELDGKPQRADYRRLTDVEFPVNFTDDPTKVGKEIGGVKFEKANTYYETQEFSDKMRPIFLDMLLGVYRAHKDTSKGDAGLIFTVPEKIRLKSEQFIENQNLFVKVFNENWEKVDIDPNKEGDVAAKTTEVITIWYSITMSDEYKSLNFREKRQYSRNEFYKWIEENYTITKKSGTGKMMKGLIKKDDDEKKADEEEN